MCSGASRMPPCSSPPPFSSSGAFSPLAGAGAGGSDGGEPDTTCLVCEERRKIADVVPVKIKGIPGSQSSGTAVCIKRKIRNFVSLVAGEEPGMRIYVQDKGIALNQLHEEAYSAKGLKSSGSKQNRADVELARAWMSEQFYDIRMFGAVMTTGVNCGQVRGPVQITFARSIDPIFALDVSITRVAITKKDDADVVQGEDGKAKGKITEMGCKPMVPYALYRAHGFFSGPFAERTGVKAEDMSLFWLALQRMWDLDRSSSRGMMSCRWLYVFTHNDKLGKAPAHELFKRIEVRRGDDVIGARSIEG